MRLKSVGSIVASDHGCKCEASDDLRHEDLPATPVWRNDTNFSSGRQDLQASKDPNGTIATSVGLRHPDLEKPFTLCLARGGLSIPE
jgi:hypothetical protein